MLSVTILSVSLLSFVMVIVIMLSTILLKTSYAECYRVPQSLNFYTVYRCLKCLNAKCTFMSKCCYAGRCYAECHYAQCRNVEMLLSRVSLG
jgi:hypothetical protein